MQNTFLYSFRNVTAESVNFIWVTYGKLIEIGLKYDFFVPDFPYMNAEYYFDFIDCVFDHSSVPDKHEKYFHNCQYPTDKDHVSFETLEFSKKLMTKCKTPQLHPTLSPLIIASITIPVILVLSVACLLYTSPSPRD